MKSVAWEQMERLEDNYRKPPSRFDKAVDSRQIFGTWKHPY